MTESTHRQLLNPAVVKGIAFALTGLFILAAPHLAESVLRFLVAGVLLLVGVSDFWGHHKGRDSAHGLARATLAIAGGMALLIASAGTVRIVELVVAGYLVGLGLLALHGWFNRDDETADLNIDAWKGAAQLAIAVLILILPGALFSVALAAVAVSGVVVGLVMIAWGVRSGPRNAEVANRGLAVEIFRCWLYDQDLGPDRRDAIADTLYFEGPDRRSKITSYVFMLLLSVAIASLAVLQDSTAVIIGAMLVAPLMTPIMGCAAGIVSGWRIRVLRSFAVVAASVAAAIGLAWILASWIPALVPLGVNSQVLSRSSPTLLDMAIALAAGAAGAYATVDDRVSSSLTGVAVAVALVPPLGVVGIALQAGQWHAAYGAFLLFATNLVSIILASMVVFVLIGLSPVKKVLEDRKSIADLLAMVAVATLLIMVPLGLTGKGALRDSERTRRAQRQTAAWLGADSTVQLVRVTTRGEQVNVMLTGSGEVPSVAELESALAHSFGAPVKVTVEHFPSVVITSANQSVFAEQNPVRGPDEEGDSPQETGRRDTMNHARHRLSAG